MPGISQTLALLSRWRVPLLPLAATKPNRAQDCPVARFEPGNHKKLIKKRRRATKKAVTRQERTQTARERRNQAPRATSTIPPTAGFGPAACRNAYSCEAAHPADQAPACGGEGRGAAAQLLRVLHGAVEGWRRSWFGARRGGELEADAPVRDAHQGRVYGGAAD
eukprot:4953194-Pleurochrysis_carterae.AAC.1